MADKINTDRLISRRGILKGTAITTGALAIGIGAADIVETFVGEKRSQAEDLIYSTTVFMENFLKGHPKVDSISEEAQKMRRTGITVALKHIADGDIKLDQKTERALEIYFTNGVAGASTGDFAFSFLPSGEIKIIRGEEEYNRYMSGSDDTQASTETPVKRSDVISKKEFIKFSDRFLQKGGYDEVDFNLRYKELDEIPDFLSSFITTHLTPNISAEEWRNLPVESQRINMNFINGFSMVSGSIGPEIELDHKITVSDDVFGYIWSVKLDVDSIRDINKTSGKLDFNPPPLGVGLDNFANSIASGSVFISPSERETNKLFADYKKYLKGK